ncbi:unnamed protein product, partial [Didymodactylos carnosus]
ESTLWLYVDSEENVFVSEVGNSRITKWSPPSYSQRIVVAGTGTAGVDPKQLNYPTALTIDGKGNLYTADTDNHRIQKWSPPYTKGITFVDKTGAPGFSANKLNQPSSVKLDSTQTYVYICDRGNNRVQKFTLSQCP